MTEAGKTTLEKARKFCSENTRSLYDSILPEEIAAFCDEVTAELQKENARLKPICAEIQEIMQDYREQESEGRISTPGGLEHMGDVWRLLRKWDAALSKEEE